MSSFYLLIHSNIFGIIFIFWLNITINTSSIVQHQAYIKLIKLSNNNNFILLLSCPSNDYYDDSIIHLNSLNTDTEPLNVFTIKSDGHIESINNLLQTQHFHGMITNSKWNHVITIYATGIIAVVKKKISLMIFTDSNEFYLTPRISFDENHQNNNSNPHFIIIDNQLPHRFFIPNLFPLNSRRHRRSTNNSSIYYCGIKLRINYDLFQEFNGDLISTVQHSQFVLRFLNQIFFQTKWSENGFENSSIDMGKFGVVPCKIIIETEPQQFTIQSNWTYSDMDKYIRSISDGDFCLSHVFTNVNLYNINGMTYKSRIFDENINGGISSFGHCENPWEIYCILSVVHEFGHNFGSSHDIENEDCMPEEGGSYIMSFPFNDKKGPNNFKFSPCSNRAIYHNLAKKKGQFITMYLGSCSNKNKCGDGILEKGEECDEGPKGGHCCDKKCHLKPEAECSKSQPNALCCNDECKIRQKGEQCLPKDLNFCLNNAVCDGFSYECPNRNKLPDNTSCGDKHLDGFCYNGYCKMCERRIDGCYFCCVDKFQKTCITNPIMMPAGSTCHLKDSSMPGRCDLQGKCQDLNSIIGTTELPSTTIPIEKIPLGPSIQEIIAIVISITIIILVAILICAYMLAEKNSFDDEYDGGSKVELISSKKRGSSNLTSLMAVNVRNS
nr:ADAM 17-like protease isoform X2 [Dermatophagoides farinae]